MAIILDHGRNIFTIDPHGLRNRLDAVLILVGIGAHGSNAILQTGKNRGDLIHTVGLRLNIAVE